LSFGAEAEVIEPLQLRSVIADEAAIMNDFYHSSSKKKG
jgi:predicted DNA-binding transcriptional regulator YafY